MSKPPLSPLTNDTIREWLAALGWDFTQIEPLEGDVSARRYVRISAARPRPTAILAIYPTADPSLGSFVKTTGLLREFGVRVPEIYASDPDRGLMLLEDCGLRNLYEADREHRLLPGRLDELEEIATLISSLPTDRVAAINPDLDEEVFTRELEQTRQVVFGRLGLGNDAPAGRDLDELCGWLVLEVSALPRAPCHRDFMIRNVLVAPDQSFSIIDHQDLRLGPIGYDLAALFNDTYRLPRRLIARKIEAHGLDREAFLLVALQRCLKIIGTFQSFANRGHRQHTPLMQPTWQRARWLIEQIDGFSGLGRELSHYRIPRHGLRNPRGR